MITDQHNVKRDFGLEPVQDRQNFSKTLGNCTDGYLSFSELVFKQDNADT
jgi:hypothetical protein